MAAVFLTELRIQKSGPQLWTLTDDLIFFSALYRGYLRVPSGFVTNFASIPRIFWRIFPPVDIYDAAAVIHDAGYNNCLQTIMGARVFTIKKVADDLFLEGMLALGVDESKANLMYDLVKVFGTPDGPLISADGNVITSNYIFHDSSFGSGSLSLCPLSATA